MSHFSYYHAINHTNSQILVSSIMACFNIMNNPEGFSYTLPNTGLMLNIYCPKWGTIGQVIINDPNINGQSFSILPASFNSSDEVNIYKSLLQSEVLGPRGRLAELCDQADVYQKILMEALYEKRLERQMEFKDWLSHQLKIFGYRDIYIKQSTIDFSPSEEYFNFPIKGTPAQFSVMLQQFSTLLVKQTEYQKLKFKLLFPGSRQNSDNIPSDANPIETTFSLDKNILSIHAHLLPDEGTLLRVHLNGNEMLWKLWDTIRDELIKLGWFCFPQIPEISLPLADEELPEQTTPTIDIWLSIPNIGPNREILRYWHHGLTCAQIGARVSLSEKTILNRINKLRKEYGKVIVPYRKSNYLNK